MPFRLSPLNQVAAMLHFEAIGEQAFCNAEGAFFGCMPFGEFDFVAIAPFAHHLGHELF